MSTLGSIVTRVVNVQVDLDHEGELVISLKV